MIAFASWLCNKPQADAPFYAIAKMTAMAKPAVHYNGEEAGTALF